MNYEIVKASKNDFNEINKLFIEMLETIYNKTGFDGYQSNDLDRFFGESNDFILLAKINNEAIGFLSIEVHKEEDDFIYLDDFSVTSKYRGNGIGLSLINESFKYCEKIGFKKIRLHVEKNNIKALNFYTRLGFNEYEDCYNRFLMQKEL